MGSSIHFALRTLESPAGASEDNDGWLDLITVTGHVYPQVDMLPSGSSAGFRGPKLLQMNQRDGTFCDASEQAGLALQLRQVSRGLAVGDLFNDGNMDIVVENLEGKPMILRNAALSGQHGPVSSSEEAEAIVSRLEHD